MASIKNDRVTLVIASGGTSGTCQIEDWPVMGIIVPTLDSSTLKFQVGYDGTTFYDIKDTTGTQLLNYSAGTGNFAIAARDVADIIGYRYLRAVCGSAQTGGARTFEILQRAPRTK